MIVYWILLLVIAFLAYCIGSISTMRVASRFVFHRNLRRLGTGSVWVSNFKRIFGWWGFGKLLLTEVVKDLIPILLGAALLALKHHAAVGAAFGGYCMLVGRLWPVFNEFRGTHHGCVALVVTALSVNFSVGASAAVVMLIVFFLTRYFSLGALSGAAIVIVVALLMVDDRLLMMLCICSAGLVFLYHIPAIRRLSQGREERFNFREDITYKLDE
jgi:glycerol-3-phosphate acyltransferase PlsY